MASPGGFPEVAWLAAVSWAVAATLLMLLGRAASGPPRAVTPARLAVGVVREDHALLRFALASGPATLLTTEAAVVVPLSVSDGRLTTLFLSAGALCAAAAQFPLWRPTLIRHGLALGFGLAGVLHGLAQGALLTALFHHIRQLTPPGLNGAYFGAVNFVSGVAALAGKATIRPPS
ncbi:hypothetical protein AB0J74_15990 [Asanoa sp. NPDC049573]|uniref:hypothetical protein n=1 Tax=Asanoa sp. NPDC049573 TaxID=3155396 RepID=UPI0034346578